MKSTDDPALYSTADFGVRLRHFRRQRQLSEEMIGQMIGVPGKHIAMMERGELIPAAPVREQFQTLVEAADLYAATARPNVWSACPDQQAFGIRLVGDSMEPHYQHGQVVVVMPNCAPKHGCLVVARLLTEGVLFKRFTVCKSRPRQFKLCSYNRKYPPVRLTWEEVQWVYPVFSAKGDTTRRNRLAT